MIRVVIIDDHVVVRAGLRYIIEANPALEFAGEFGGGVGAVEFVTEKDPDIVLLDVRMPDRGGIDVLKDLLKANPRRRVVMLTTSDVEEDVFQAIEEGAFGYVMKESPVETISAAILSAYDGEVFMTDEVRRIYETRRNSKGLSSREAEALSLCAKGSGNREIAKEMGLSENSVKMFLKRAFFKLGASNRAEAVQLAVRRGLIEGFTLVELMVVVMVMALLMMIVFRLGQVASGTSERSVTIDRMQRLENCLSGYYAAFGSYPPVKLHGSRNIYYKVNGYGIQQVRDDPDESQIVWSRVEAACRSQPVAMNYPYDDVGGIWDYVKKVSQILTQRHNNGEKGFENPALANLFDALENPSQLGGKQDKADWTETQLFRFGLLSFLLPRYLIMMRHNGIGFESMSSSSLNIYDDFKQWGNNNQMPCRFEDGTPYEDWRSLANEDKWKIALLPSQAVCARWLPNLEGGVLTCDQNLSFYGVSINSTTCAISPDNPNPPLFSSGDSQSGEGASGSQQYVLASITCWDGYGREFYYYSVPPYQSYRLWSAGPNGKTFPPWIPEEELNRMNEIDRKNVLEWVSDDIVRMKN